MLNHPKMSAALRALTPNFNSHRGEHHFLPMNTQVTPVAVAGGSNSMNSWSLPRHILCFPERARRAEQIGLKRAPGGDQEGLLGHFHCTVRPPIRRRFFLEKVFKGCVATSKTAGGRSPLLLQPYWDVPGRFPGFRLLRGAETAPYYGTAPLHPAG